MKQVFLVWFAVSITIFILFNENINFVSYVNRISNTLSTPWNLLKDIGNTFNQMNYYFTYNPNFFDILAGIGMIFKVIIQSLLLPISFLAYLVGASLSILPFGVETL